MKERPKRNIVLTYTKRSEYKYYDKFSVQQRAEERRRKRQSGFASTSSPDLSDLAAAAENVKGLQVRLERVDERIGIKGPKPKARATESATKTKRKPVLRKFLPTTDMTPSPSSSLDNGAIIKVENLEAMDHEPPIDLSPDQNTDDDSMESDFDAMEYSYPFEDELGSGIRAPTFSQAEQAPKKMFQCTFCSNSYTEERYLEFHSKVHVNQVPPKIVQISKFTCLHKNCFKQCTRYEDLMLHKRLAHPDSENPVSNSGENPDDSEGEDGSMDNKAKIFYFSKVIDKNTGFECFRCSTCEKVFTSKSDLTAHIRRHRNDNPFPCPTCHKTYTTQYTLRTHMRRHENPRPFKCPDCPRKLSSRASLRIHARFHSSEKPYSCRLCPQTFSSNSSLCNHMMNHNPQFPFKCKHCSLYYKSLKGLQAHSRTHVVKKAGHRCPVCRKKFIHRSNFDTHVRNHQLKELEQTPVSSPMKFSTSTDERSPMKSNTAERSPRKSSTTAESPRKSSTTAESPRKSSTTAESPRKSSTTAESPRKSSTTAESPMKSSATERSPMKPNTAEGSPAKPSTANESHMKMEPSTTKLESKPQAVLLTNILNDSIVPGKTPDNSLCIRRKQEIPKSDDDVITETNVFSPASASPTAEMNVDSPPPVLSPQVTLPEADLTENDDMPYNCDLCSATFRLHSSFVRHSKIVHSIKIESETYEPERNRKLVPNKSERKERVQTPDELAKDLMKVHECPYCRKRMTRKDALKIHINSHTGAKPYNCQYCRMAFGNPANLYRHKQLYCPVRRGRDHSSRSIGQAAPTPSTRGRRILPQAEDIVATPDLSEELQPETETLQAPIQKNVESASVVTTNAPVIYYLLSSTAEGTTQLIPMTGFNNSLNLQQILPKMNITNSSDINCPAPVSTPGSAPVITTPTSPEDTQNSIDNGSSDSDACNATDPGRDNEDSEFECSVCLEKYFGYRSIIKHMHTHTNPDKFCCHLCNKSLSSKSSLGVHFLIHLGVTWTCPVPNCGKKLSKKHSLLEHLRTHSGQTPFACTKCGKEFPNKGSLTRHKKMYTIKSCVDASQVGTSSTHICEICKAGFGLKQELENHILNQHTMTDAVIKSEPLGVFQCDYCSKLFGSLFGLSRHCKAEHSDILDEESRSTAEDIWGSDEPGSYSQSKSNEDIEIIDLEPDEPELVNMDTDQQQDDEEGDDEFEGDEEEHPVNASKINPQPGTATKT